MARTAGKRKAARGRPSTAKVVRDFAVEVEANGKVCRLDLLAAELAIEEVERDHGATAENKDWMTSGYYQDLAEAFTRLGVDGCTVSQAFQLRELVIREFDGAKKNILDGQG